MRPLRNFKTNQCCHLIGRIAHRAFFLNDEEKTRFDPRPSEGHKLDRKMLELLRRY